ncbi:VOC family protein [Streptomyces hesseae]|uniref:VOC family protein n=1 Tax=Streptomyces hesseae TaxID=3075519 RepID=A0ABU2SHT4_9ACTN|nr:VOC family protein [Streptomyces sp. DSM 40473]MDT0448538.1 VOC family protein [Streptomyces sp. DSM 40473]
MGHDIVRLHHVGHIVEDMAQAIGLYERLGFVVPPPSCPAMPRREGAVPEPFGAANTHADFANSFLELATCVKDGDTARLPADARLVPLEAPAEVLPVLVKRIGETSANLAACLGRFEGLHILMFSSPAIDEAAARLTAAGVRHGGVNMVRRAAPPGAEVPVETVRYLEIDGDEPGAGPGSVAEGRVGVVAALDPDVQGARALDHPNGALELVEAMLCVADPELAEVRRRYETYLGRPARRAGPALVFDLDGAALRLVPHSGLAALLPGERKPAALPALVSCTVVVRDLALTRDLLRRNGLPLRETPSGDMFVPADAALGAAVVFRPRSPDRPRGSRHGGRR